MYCSATNKQGNPCRAQAISGAKVCRKHGGNAPQVREAARIRLLSLVDPALGVLARATRPRKSPKWEPSAQEIAAAKEIIARAGIGEADKLELSGTVSVADTLRAKRAERLKSPTAAE